MVDKRIPDLPLMSTPPARGDLLEIVKVADTTDNATGSSYRITAATLLQPRVFTPEQYLAVPDSYYTDGSATASSTTFTSSTANFNQATDAGKTIVILRGGSSSAQDHHTTIASVQSTTSCTLTVAAGRTTGAARFYISRGGDSTASVQAAVDAAATTGGGIVQAFGVGYLVTEVIVKNRVQFVGAGRRSTLFHQVAAANRPCVRSDYTTNDSAKFIKIADMWIDGNRVNQSDITTTLASGYTAGGTTLALTDASAFLPSGSVLIGTTRFQYESKSGNSLINVGGGYENTTDANQSAGATVTQHKGHGIYIATDPFNSGGTIEDSYDGYHTIQNVNIKNVKGEGVTIWGQSEARVENVWVQYADHTCFRPSYDTWLINCTADTGGRMGYYSRFSDVRMIGCKAFYCGGNVAADGHGFLIEGPTAIEEGDKVLSGCSAQDNKACGVFCLNAQRVMATLTLSTNSTSGSGLYPALLLDGCTNGIIDAVCVERKASPNNMQQYALKIAQTAVTTTGMTVRVTHGAPTGVTVSEALMPGSVNTGSNNVIINGFQITGGAVGVRNFSTAASSAGFATDTYIPNSNVQFPVTVLPVAGMRYKLRFAVSKTAAGTATPILTIRIGTAGTIADTARGTLTFAAGTAAIDTGFVDVEVVFRTVGSTTTAVVSSMGMLTGGAGFGTKGASAVSAGFDSTTPLLYIGASWNGGTSAVHTMQQVDAELVAA